MQQHWGTWMLAALAEPGRTGRSGNLERQWMAEAEPGSTSAIKWRGEAVAQMTIRRRSSPLELWHTNNKEEAPGWQTGARTAASALTWGQGLVVSCCQELQVTRGLLVFPRRHSPDALGSLGHRAIWHVLSPTSAPSPHLGRHTCHNQPLPFLPRPFLSVRGKYGAECIPSLLQGPGKA